MEAIGDIGVQFQAALEEFQQLAAFKAGNLIVVGGSSSEIMGLRIGSATNMDLARQLIPLLRQWGEQHQLYVAVQCCEHLNRCLVVEEECAAAFCLEEVNVVPYEKGGGALGAAAMELFTRPVVVESLRQQAHGGLDIGNTFIGMHLRRVVVCVRLSIPCIGAAPLNCARTRPPLIGGPRARHNPLG